MTSGLLLGVSPMDERSFTAFGVAMIPYLMFNAGFGVGPEKGVLTKWLFMDFIGNVIFAIGSGYCVKLLREGSEGKKGQ